MKVFGRIFQVERRARTEVLEIETNMMSEDRKKVNVAGVLSDKENVGRDQNSR